MALPRERPRTVPALGAARAGWLVLLLALVAWVPQARADVATAPGSRLQVALLTYGPGRIYWERFGHDAIEIRDRLTGEAVAYNYGMFDFDQDNFLLNFARGRMRYAMAGFPADRDIAFYRGEGRRVRRQQLDLTPAQKTRLRDFLAWNAQPAHAAYAYDYFTSNCATKVRDALDRALGGVLHQQLATRPARLTWRQQTDRLMAAQPWLMLLLDLGLSGHADQPLDAWQEAFLPMRLADEIATIHLTSAGGVPHPLVIQDSILAPARLVPPPAQPPDLRLPLLLAGAVLALVLAACGRARGRGAQRVFAALGTLWMLLAGLAGTLMLALWLLTEHQAAWANANLLLFNPLAWLLIPAMWQPRVRPRAHALAWLLTALAGFALLAHLTPVLEQRNLPWILFALPVWLAVLHVLGRRQIAR